MSVYYHPIIVIIQLLLFVYCDYCDCYCYAVGGASLVRIEVVVGLLDGQIQLLSGVIRDLQVCGEVEYEEGERASV